MKILLFLFSWLLDFPLWAQTTNTITTNLTRLPELVEVYIGWDHSTDGELFTYRLYSGTNLIRTYSSTNYTITGMTNQSTSYRALAPGLVMGTNMLTLAALNMFTNYSEPSNILPIKVLGKPEAPSGPRKL